ncbi:hypothetical protein [Marivirga tractuosa]|nr:hypothetical protein [Marivirga tractuosa]
MKKKFVDYFSRGLPLSKEKAEAIAESMQTKQFKKSEFLVQAGQFKEAL